MLLTLLGCVLIVSGGVKFRIRTLPVSENVVAPLSAFTCKLASKAVVLFPVKNEEDNLAACLKSVAWAAEVWVVDSHSTDRTAAIAERLWSAEQIRDIDSMYRRLRSVSQKLVYYGLRHRLISDEMLERMSGESDPGPLKVLAAVVQPPRLYERQELRTFTDFTPLNRMDDAVPPESDTAREFNEIAKRISSGRATSEEWRRARAWLMLWRNNDAALQPLLARSVLTKDLTPVSRNLSEVAAIGLRALDDLQEKRTVKGEDRRSTIEFLQRSAKPQAVLLLMVVPSVQLLVEATRTD